MVHNDSSMKVPFALGGSLELQLLLRLASSGVGPEDEFIQTVASCT